jgi:hypothetical protein
MCMCMLFSHQMLFYYIAGEMKDNKKHGQGKMVYTNGEIYEVLKLTTQCIKSVDNYSLFW